MSPPRSHSGGEYVFHQKTVAEGMWCVVLDETMSRIANCVGTTPPWWYTPMRKPMAALKMTHTARRRRERRMGTQLRRRGTAGRRKRGSWWGKRERSMVAESAERARTLRIQYGTSGQLKRETSMVMYTGPRSWRRFAVKC